MNGLGHNGGPHLNRGRQGWVAVSRAIRDHWLVGFGQAVKAADAGRGAMSRAEAWIDLIMECRYEDGMVMNGGRRMALQRGQLVGAVSWLASRWNWTPMTVRGFLDKLEGEGMIERSQPGISSTSNMQAGKQATIITVSNFDLYQVLDDYLQRAKQQAHSTQTTSRQHASNNNYKDNKGTKEQEREYANTREEGMAEAKRTGSVIVNCEAIYGPDFTLDFAAIDTTAELLPFDKSVARRIAEVCARDWVANKTRPQQPMAMVKAAIVAHHRGEEVHGVRLRRAASYSQLSGNAREREASNMTQIARSRGDNR